VLADLDACARLEQSCFALPWTSAMLRTELDAGAELLVADRDPQRRPLPLAAAAAAAAVEAYAVLRSAPPDAELLRLGVTPAARRSGGARALLDEALRRLRANGVVELFLEVRNDNVVALALYEALGFERLATRRRYYADGGDALVLRRAVP
jgi:ribosomal-protein-alanine acetyltransferase